VLDFEVTALVVRPPKKVYPFIQYHNIQIRAEVLKPAQENTQVLVSLSTMHQATPFQQMIINAEEDYPTATNICLEWKYVDGC